MTDGDTKGTTDTSFTMEQFEAFIAAIQAKRGPGFVRYMGEVCIYQSGQLPGDEPIGTSVYGVEAVVLEGESNYSPDGQEER